MCWVFSSAIVAALNFDCISAKFHEFPWRFPTTAFDLSSQAQILDENSWRDYCLDRLSARSPCRMKASSELLWNGIQRFKELVTNKSHMLRHSRPLFASIQSESMISSFCQPASVFQFVVTFISPLLRKIVLNSRAIIDGSRLVLRSPVVFTPNTILNLVI